MKAILDTHFLLWIVNRSGRLEEYPWIERYRPWGISPVSLLEIQFLSEVGRLEAQNPDFTDTLVKDDRFLIDEVPLFSLFRRAIDLTWTRDPFDRLLAAHSSVRKLPLCTVDRTLRRYHRLLPDEIPALREGI